jgi:hypothetical protein
MGAYTRVVTCSNGHTVRLCFEWEPDGIGDPEEYSNTCPVSGCEASVTGRLPVGAEPGSARFSTGNE